MSSTLRITTMDHDRASLIEKILEGRITQKRAAEQLQITPRQLRRMMRAYEQDGMAGLVSKRRGRRSNNRTADRKRAEIMRIVRRRYADFGPTLAAEKLLECHGLEVSRETLRHWMTADGLWIPRKRRDGRIQQPRGRRACFGELVQIDGCDHDWFEDRAERCVALVFVDDATSSLMWVQLCEAEDMFSYFAAMRGYLRRHGRPVALYSDKASVFRSHKNVKDTQFGRAMRDLNVDSICANTAAAKGRVERMHLTLQDRLVKELRLRGIDNVQDANAFVEGEFLDSYNDRFAKAARSDFDAHRDIPKNVVLKDVFQRQERRKTSKSLTVHYRNRLYILKPDKAGRDARAQWVDVFEDAEGNVEIRRKGVVLSSAVFAKEGVTPAQTERPQGEIVPNKLLRTTIDNVKKKQVAKELSRIEGSRTRREKRLIRGRLKRTKGRSANALP